MHIYYCSIVYYYIMLRYTRLYGMLWYSTVQYTIDKCIHVNIMYVYIYIHTHVCICIYIYIYIYIQLYIYI